ncbi:hypothetical protein [Pseudomonas sp. EMN2]|uniref:hypothetical protein n=1 Tax=Pseudomonas sp. EMN2 TaxID=2615212 RepID=UPI00129B4BCE|nr:hypothetical protein [Pseudomonas sp. EMN2]
MKPFDNLDAAKKANVQVKSYSRTDTNRGVAWSCNVYLGGKKLGMVSNDGSGGMTMVDISTDLQRQVVEALKVAGYQLELTLGDCLIDEPDTVEGWFEFAIGQMGDEVFELKYYKRRAKTHTFVEKLTAPFFAEYKAQDTPVTRAALQRQLGQDLVRFLNDTIQAY